MPEDLPAIGLFCLGLAFLLRGNLPLFHAVFAIGTLNRESIILLLPAFLLVMPVRGRGTVPKTILHCALMLASWCVVRRIVFGLLPGGPPSLLYEDHLQENLRFVSDLFSLERHTLRVWMTFGGLWILVPQVWRRTPPVLRRLLLIIPMMILVMLKTGNMAGEARIWNELVPLYSAVIAVCLKQITDSKMHVQDDCTTEAAER